MTTITATTAPIATRASARSPSRPTWLTALLTLARRRLALNTRNPRELIVPLMTPVVFAVVIAPALADTVGGSVGGVDYMTFVAISTIGLLIPLSCMLAGLGVVVDRLGGARRDLVSAPIPRSLIVLGNLLPALLLSGLQLVALLAAATLRGAEFDIRTTGLLWFAAAVTLLAVGMYGIAETLANRIQTQEEYVGALPLIAIIPWFLAGSLFPISALPAGLTVVAKVLPLTHVLALARYGLLDSGGSTLHDIWGMDSSTTMAALSLTVVAVFALAITALAIRVFTRTATQ